MRYRVHKSPPLNPTQSQSNPVRPIDLHHPKVHINVILQPTSTYKYTSFPKQSNLIQSCHISRIVLL